MTELAASDLPTIYPKPTPRVIAKARPEVDAHAKKFIAMSPFCVLATSGSDGSVDASPRGGNPGFVHVAGPKRLLMPDRSGNNRIDSFRNIAEGSGFVHIDAQHRARRLAELHHRSQQIGLCRQFALAADA